MPVAEWKGKLGVGKRPRITWTSKQPSPVLSDLNFRAARRGTPGAGGDYGPAGPWVMMADWAAMGNDFPDQIRAMQERIRGGRCLSRDDLPALEHLLSEALAAVQQNAALIESLDEIEARLWELEDSRFLRLVRWPGRMALDWRGRLGHLLLHSPLHPLYLRVARSHGYDRTYQQWVEHERKATPPREWFEERGRRFQRRPVCSILMPVHNPRREWIEAAIESVRQQYYADWQLCICDDGSEASWVMGCLEKAAADPRIRFVRAGSRLGIAGALNRAAELGAGEYVAFLDHDDVLPPYALHYVAAALQNNAADLIYSDEDRLNQAGRRVEPILKPAWSPDLLLSCMYLGHFLVVKRSRFEEAGGFRPGVDGSQDHDLALRVTSRPAMVRHIPRILYHWRKHGGSTASSATAKPYTQAAGRNAVEEALKRRGIDAVVEDGKRPHTYRVRRSAVAGKATLVICSRREDLALRCLRAVRDLTDYSDREVILVEHGVRIRLENLEAQPMYYEGEFNFAHMNNLGAKAAGGDWLVFLNDDVIPLHREWLTELARQVARPEVGVAGARLLYPSGAIQHAGIVIGIMGAAGHPHRDTFGSPYWNWFDVTRNVSAVTGACMAMRRSVFEDLGGFDEAFPINFNDVDLCLRARQAGYEVIYEPAAVLRHDECQTRQPRVRWKDCQRWRAKWPDMRVGGDPFYSPHLSTEREDASLRLKEPLSPEDNSR